LVDVINGNAKNYYASGYPGKEGEESVWGGPMSEALYTILKLHAKYSKISGFFGRASTLHAFDSHLKVRCSIKPFSVRHMNMS
jgi:hypothetical protein